MLKSKYWRRLTGGGLLCLLAACASKQPPAPVVELSRPPEPRISVEQQRQQVRVMLANAQQALAEDRLMVPEAASAYSWYRKVLALDHASAEAHWGMHQITARYLQLAEQAYKSRRVDKAEQLLQRAEMIAASPADTEVIRARYQRAERDNEVLLVTKALSARNAVIQKQLADVAQLAKDKKLRLLIVARNDAEGRWVYKQMRSSVEGYRLRGNIEVGQVPRIVLLDQ